ncbi:MAG TPA: hypothetical protein VFI08_10525, partial [Spirochaetia bacterium]|nr:hypothetical protein [Spirochaetia bacterium]
MSPRILRAAVALVLGLAATVRAAALEGEVDVNAAPTAALGPISGTGSPLAQAEATRVTSQLALSGHASPAEGLTLSATGWALLDSLPDNNPLNVPGTRLAFASRVLQADVSWQIIPGVLIWDTGKQVIHPSSGFFRTPLDLLSRGAAGNVPQRIPAAAPQWEEGWIGTRILWLVGDLSVEDFFVPRLAWSSSSANPMVYVSAP